MPYLPAKDEVVSFNCLSSRGLWKVLKFQGFRPATIWRGAAFHFLAVFSKKEILWKLWLWFSKMFHQRVFPDWKWSISKFQFWRQILDIYRQPLLKKVNVMMEDVFICIGLRQDKKPNWLTWSEPELIIRLLFLLFYCLTVPLHVHVLFPFHFFAESRFRLFKSEKMWSDPIRLCPGGGDGGGGVLSYISGVGMCHPIG